MRGTKEKGDWEMSDRNHCVQPAIRVPHTRSPPGLTCSNATIAGVAPAATHCTWLTGDDSSSRAASNDFFRTTALSHVSSRTYTASDEAQRRARLSAIVARPARIKLGLCVASSCGWLSHYARIAPDGRAGIHRAGLTSLGKATFSNPRVTAVSGRALGLGFASKACMCLRFAWMRAWLSMAVALAPSTRLPRAPTVPHGKKRSLGRGACGSLFATSVLCDT